MKSKIKKGVFNMKKKFYVKVLGLSAMSGLAALVFVSLAGTVTPSMSAQAKLDTAKIEQLTGVKGEMNEKEGVFTVRAPRTDLQVTAAGVKMNPAKIGRASCRERVERAEEGRS